MQTIHDFFARDGWECAHQIALPARPGTFEAYEDLGLSHPALNLLRRFEHGIYRHQKAAITHFFAGANVCLATSTASGKSLVFQLCIIEHLARHPSARMLAIYPLKALATEQLERWRTALRDAGLSCQVGRIDGGVPVWKREEIVRTSHILVLTPDVLHAWFLANIPNSAVRQFLRRLAIVVIDEAHMYSGVFGSNAAFLFRRLEHISKKLHGSLTYIAASATIHNPAAHLKQLFGHEFAIIGPEHETTPKKACDVLLVNPPPTPNFLTALSNLVTFLAQSTPHKFIAFVDSRKQTEYLAAIAARQFEQAQGQEPEQPGQEPEQLPADGNLLTLESTLLNDLHISPYRAGYEEVDRQQIQERLTSGALKGVISTSALEMGIDIPALTLGILVGIPSSATSFHQRIGRIARHQEGTIIIVNNGSLLTRSIFRQPQTLLKMPLSESTLYLENRRIQYIHALCLARKGGEDDRLNEHLASRPEKLHLHANFPANFVTLCQSEQRGEIAPDLQMMKVQAGDYPHTTFPLRDVDVQYQVEYKRGVEQRKLGSLSYGQLMREAYPGAVYYYFARSFRVARVNTFRKLVEVRHEKRYTTTPIPLPTRIFPNLSAGQVYHARRYGDLLLVECNLQVRESLAGYSEQRGSASLTVHYPLETQDKYSFEIPRFTRNYFTSGVLLLHPALKQEQVQMAALATLLFEAFLMLIPFERQDIHNGCDTCRVSNALFPAGERFLALYDQTYGSLRLTSRLLDDTVAARLFAQALDITTHDTELVLNNAVLNAESRAALQQMQACLAHPPEAITLETAPPATPEHMARVIVPGSVGLNVSRDNEEFLIDEVFFHPRHHCLMYRGKHLSQQQAKNHERVVVTVPASHIQEIPGESQTGWYDYVSGTVQELPA